MRSIRRARHVCLYALALAALGVTMTGCLDAMPIQASYAPARAMAIPSAQAAEEASAPPRTDAQPREESPTTAPEPKVAPEAEAPAPELAPAPAPPAPLECGEDLCGVININEATRPQLELLPRVGPALSARIVAYRERRRFGRPAHLRRVKGIGPATYARVQAHVRIEGATTLRPAEGR